MSSLPAFRKDFYVPHPNVLKRFLLFMKKLNVVNFQNLVKKVLVKLEVTMDLIEEEAVEGWYQPGERLRWPRWDVKFTCF